MSRTATVASLEAQKADLQRKLKQIDAAIKQAKEREKQAKQAKILEALEARGLLDKDLDALLLALDNSAQQAGTAAPAEAQQ